MAPFASVHEDIVASSLLLLSTEPPSLSTTKQSSSFDEAEASTITSTIKEKSNNDKERLMLGYSKSCSVSLTTGDGLSELSRARCLEIIAVLSEMKLKVVQKSNFRRCGRRRMTSGTMLTKGSGSVPKITDPSCSRVARGREKGKHAGSAQMLRGSIRAEAVRGLLSGGGSSEAKIRQELGDSPDTSKALRLLLRLGEIKRSGAGGRLDPYIYTIAPEKRENNNTIN